MRAPMSDRFLGLLIVVAIGAIACIVEKPAPPRADVQGSVAFTLTHESPTAIRAVRFEARPGLEPLSTIALRASVDEPSVDPADRADVWVSIADPQTGALPGPSQYGSAGLGKSAYVGTCEVEGCDRTWVAIARWMEPVAERRVDLELSAFIDAQARDDPMPDDPPFTLEEMSVTEDPKYRSDRGLAVERALIEDRVRVAAGEPDVVRTFLLRATKEAVAVEPRFPILSRMRFWSNVVDESGGDVGASGSISIDGEIALGNRGDGATEINWLDRCEPGATCVVPLEMTWTLDFGTATPPPDAWAELEWRLEARLEAPDGTVLPADALVLEEEPDGPAVPGASP